MNCCIVGWQPRVEVCNASPGLSHESSVVPTSSLVWQFLGPHHVLLAVCVYLVMAVRLTVMYGGTSLQHAPDRELLLLIRQRYAEQHCLEVLNT